MKRFFPGAARTLVLPLRLLAAALASLPAQAQQGVHSPVTAEQHATAQQVAEAGVPLSALAPDAPDGYTVRRGDTLWGISGRFLRSPWRWPELWGMNLRDIRNPHLIYPGQQLYLERVGGRAFLRARRAVEGQPGDTVRVSPRNRAEVLGAGPLPTLQPHLIEPFLPRASWPWATRTACWRSRATAPTRAARPMRRCCPGQGGRPISACSAPPRR